MLNNKFYIKICFLHLLAYVHYADSDYILFIPILLYLPFASPLSSCVQGHSADDVVLKLLDSVLGTLKPLVSQSPDTSSTGSSGGGSLLSPASEQSTGLLLSLTLEIGVTVSLTMCTTMQLSVCS